MILKRFFLFLMVLSVFSLSQRSMSSQFNSSKINESTETSVHFLEHSLMNELKFLVLGFLVHTHDSNTHSHAEISRLKTDFITGQNFLFLSKELESIFGISVLNLHFYNYPFQIFRPPIFA
jgi:hypothetical protein